MSVATDQRPLDAVRADLARLRDHRAALLREREDIPAAIARAVAEGDAASVLRLERQALPELSRELETLDTELAALEAEERAAAERELAAHLAREEAAALAEQVAAEHEMPGAEVALCRIVGRVRRAIERHADVRAQVTGSPEARTAVLGAEGQRIARRLLALGALLAEVVGRPPSVQIDVDTLRRIVDDAPRAEWLAAMSDGAGQ
jgi:hypothetical protein